MSKHNPKQPSARDFGYSLEWLKTSPGARKEKVRQRSYARRSSSSHLPYFELHTASAFSFLEGGSLPEDLVSRAAELDLGAVALIDRNGVYGAPRFHQAAKQAGIQALVGAEVVLAAQAAGAILSEVKDPDAVKVIPTSAATRGPGNADVVLSEAKDPSEAPTSRQRTDGQGSLAALGMTGGAFKMARSVSAPRISLLVASRTGYRNLCKLTTAMARGRPKGDAVADWELIERYSQGLHCLAGGPEGPVAEALRASDPETARSVLDRLKALFPKRLHVEIQRHRRPRQEARNYFLLEQARALGVPIVATNGVRYARPEDRRLYDVLSVIRNHTTLDKAGRSLDANYERHLKGAAEMTELFFDLPDAVRQTVELAESLDFTLADLGYRFPDYPLPHGETEMSYLRQITWNEARARFRPLTSRAQAQIEYELAMIEKLDLAGYFLIVWDIVQFCKRKRILVQGRGSAANSAVCYALSITAVDPVKMELLFERFLSEERGEWPDIDLDLPSGDQREKVIQYVYWRYGPHGAAMTANVITYRNRSAAREVAKALGFSLEQQNQLSKQLGSWHYDIVRGDPKSLDEELKNAGFDPEAPRIRHFAEMWRRIHNIPRHLGQHSGGMVIAAGRLDEVVPLEPAAMEDRVVVQWDKDDCADLGIIKVDLLGLGMLQALEEVIPLIRTHENKDVDIAHLPPDDPATYKMLREADTVGVFQVESRAQMASLPRNNPQHFYDLVIQVAIIRPGPIVGGMVNPYFERRIGRQPVEYAHPCLEPILKRTLGVPIFQEQILRVAMEAAGFSGGEAEELRRAMGFKRSTERMHTIEANLRQGMTERGIVGDTQDAIIKSITSFALYGFPESHAASFALIAYASAYLRCHHPAAFCVALLNAWPMGFYHPATLVKDAQRHGVEVRPADVNSSGWKCRLEDGRVRLGLRYVHGLRKQSGESVEATQSTRPFESTADLVDRCDLREDELTTLAESGAMASLGLSRRQALWQVAWESKPAMPLFESIGDRYKSTSNLPGEEDLAICTCPQSPLPELSVVEETLADYSTTGITTGVHPMAHIRDRLSGHGVLQTATLGRVRDGERIKTAGTVIVRQRPGTAKGVLFITLEDETGMVQAIVRPELLRRNRGMLIGNAGLIVEGTVRHRDGSLSIQGERFWPLPDIAPTPSHDFR
ncbi:MAG: error-prone DNA polymerase [Thermoanaerobaculia bacterium]